MDLVEVHKIQVPVSGLAKRSNDAFWSIVRVMKPVPWKRGDCVAWRKLQQDVSISKWTGKESQQRLSFNHVHVMKPVLVQKRRRCSASQVADF